MSKSVIYKITLTNWSKHNAHQKKGYKATLIDNNFCQDAKLRILPMTSRWLFLNLVLSCSDMCRDTVELSSNTVRNMLESNRSIDGVLSELQELQLLTFEKIEPLKNRIEKKVREKKGIELHHAFGEAAVPVPKIRPAKTSTPAVAVVPVGQALVGFYCDAWKTRYGIAPPLRQQDTRALKQIGEANGLDRTKELLSGYLRMNEAFFLTKRHDLATFSANLTGVAQFVENGQLLTRAKLQAVENAVGLDATLRQIREEGI